MTRTAFFTSWTPDPVGVLLGTGFYRFSAPHGICGLAKIEGDTLHILAIESEDEGKGHVREFIASAKREAQIEARFREIGYVEPPTGGPRDE